MINTLLRKEVYAILGLLFVAILPLALQKGEPFDPSSADVKLVIMTPHNETIRREFGEAFADFWKEKTGEVVYIDWRTPGGTSEIRMVLDGDFTRADARGDDGIGVDVLFGGGDYFFKQMASMGRLEKLDVFKKRASLFSGEKGIRASFTGEDCYGAGRDWVGVCLSSFGICYNEDGVRRLGLDPPRSWDDLSDPKYFGHIALADPTKSGSAAKAFEVLIQQKMNRELAMVKRDPGESRVHMIERAKRQGWKKGLQLIQKIAANTRYFTDSASKIPYDVAQGDAVVGMCVDFYGRTYNEKLKREDGSSRLQWVRPEGGTSTSVDPVAVLRGAENGELAQAFVDFLLSERGQLIWNNRPGSPNGPKYHAIRRLPIRPDFYTPERLEHFTDPDVMPYSGDPDFVYNPELTAPLFNAMRHAIKVMCVDTHVELTAAWETLIDYSDGDGNMPSSALRYFSEVRFFAYNKIFELKKTLNKRRNKKEKLWVVNKLDKLAANFRRTYEDSQKLAKQRID